MLDPKIRIQAYGPPLETNVRKNKKNFKMYTYVNVFYSKFLMYYDISLLKRRIRVRNKTIHKHRSRP